MSVYPRGRAPLCPKCGRNRLKESRSTQCNQCRTHPGWHTLLAGPDAAIGEAAITVLRRHGDQSVPDLAQRLAVPSRRVRAALLDAQAAGRAVYVFGDRWSLQRAPVAATIASPYVS